VGRLRGLLEKGLFTSFIVVRSCTWLSLRTLNKDGCGYWRFVLRGKGALFIGNSYFKGLGGHVGREQQTGLGDLLEKKKNTL